MQAHHAPLPGPRRLARTAALLAVLLLLAGCADPSRSLRQDRQRNALQDRQAVQEPTATAPAAKPARPPAGPETAKAAPVDLSKPLSLDAAVTLALKNNLEALVAAQDKAVAEEMASGAKRRILPTLIVDAEQSWKSREIPSSSVSFDTRQTSLEPSISSDLWTTTLNATLAWDLVNLGVNVYRAGQAMGRVQVTDQRLRRVRQNIALDVVRAYLRAAAARDVVEHSAVLEAQARERVKILAAQHAEGVLSRSDGLVAEIDMLELALRHNGFTEQYLTAKTRLAEVMGIDPGTPFEIAGVDFDARPVQARVQEAAVEQAALANRPDLYELDQEQKISEADVSIARTQMAPAVSPFLKFSYDANTYLLRHDWFVYGLKLSWDLLAVPRLLAEQRAAQNKASLDRARRIKLTQAVMVQSRLAVIDLAELSARLPLAREMEARRKELLDVVGLQVRTGKLKESLLLEEGSKYLQARVRYLGVYTELMAARARLRNTMGLDWGESAPTPELEAAMSLAEAGKAAPRAQPAKPPQDAAPPKQAPEGRALPDVVERSAVKPAAAKPVPRPAAKAPAAAQNPRLAARKAP